MLRCISMRRKVTSALQRQNKPPVITSERKQTDEDVHVSFIKENNLKQSVSMCAPVIHLLDQKTPQKNT